MLIRINQKGTFENTERFLKNSLSINYKNILSRYGQEGVNALSEATPKDSGETANSWKYDIIKTRNGVKIIWFNTHVVDGVPIAIILQYGHATRNGGYVQGIDYINPEMKRLFENMSKAIWKEVLSK